MPKIQLFRSSIAHVVGNPWIRDDTLEYFTDGILVLQDGLVREIGASSDILKRPEYKGLDYIDYSQYLLLPGFIDTHLHYPQTSMIASDGSQLLEWLRKYTFPAEARFADVGYAESAAQFFVQQLYLNGTTTAMVFATVHAHSVDAIFDVAKRDNMRLITGKVMMDRNCPENLQDTAEASYEDSQRLIDRWHGVQRLQYAVTPRFAPTSSDRQLTQAGRLFAENDGVYLQSHVAENRGEVEWVSELFPWSRSYLDVYDHFGLLGDKAIYAHCIHLDHTDRQRMAETSTAMAFCPTSNLFLGSGLFDFKTAREQDIKVGLATDVGGGTSFSMLRTADEAYKVCQLSEQSINATQLLYELTNGGATALSLENKVGNFEAGKEGDFVVIDLSATPLMRQRMDVAKSIEEMLFALFVLGDDRSTRATYLMGHSVYDRNAQPVL